LRGKGKTQTREEDKKGRPPPGEKLGAQSTRHILRRVLGSGSLDEGLEEASKYLLELFDLRLVSILVAGSGDIGYTVRSFITPDDKLHYLQGASYRYGNSGDVDGFLGKVFSSSDPTTVSKRRIRSLLISLAGDGVVSEETFDELTRRLITSDDLNVVFFSERDSRAEPFLLLAVSSPRELLDDEIGLLAEITGSLALSVECRIRMMDQDRLVSKYEALLESREKAHFLLVGGKLEVYTERLPEMLGVSGEDLRGMRLEDYLERSDGRDLHRMIESFIEEGESHSSSYYHVYRLARGAREVEVSLNSVRVRDGWGIKGSIAALDDKNLLEKSALDSKSMENISALAGGVAHDFNNLIGAMVGYASLVRNSMEENDERVGQLRRIEEAGERAHKLTRQLLSISRKGKYRQEVVDMGDILDRVCKSCIVPMDHISCIKEYNTELMNVEGDPTQLYEALLNIAKNARESMPDGGVVNLRVDGVELDRDSSLFTEGMKAGGYLRISVKDGGCGMGSDVLRKSTELFFTTKQEAGKKGLGLPAAIGIIESHRGVLEVKSRRGTGSEVLIYLPVTRREPESTATFTPRGDTKVNKVLVVDDEQIVCELASDMLGRLGYDAVTALSGNEALEAMRNSRFDLVLLDLLMPEMNGQETFHRLKEIDPDIPVILSSGYSEDSVVQRLLEEGAISMLKKPYRLADLKVALDESARTIGRLTGGDSGHGNKRL